MIYSTANACSIHQDDSMVRFIAKGQYSLRKTIHGTLLLSLEGFDSYAWIHSRTIGDLFVLTHTENLPTTLLSVGTYRLYDVRDEPRLTDLLHLELQVGNNMWQGYLLLTGLPKKAKQKSKIVPTDECITKTKL